MKKIILSVIVPIVSFVASVSGASALDICKNAGSTQFTIVSGVCSGGISTKIGEINGANDYIDFDASGNTYTNGGIYFEEAFGGGVHIKLKATTNIKTYWNGSLTDTNPLGDISEFGTTPTYTIYNEPPPVVPSTSMITSSGGRIVVEAAGVTFANDASTKNLQSMFEIIKFLPTMALILGGMYVLSAVMGILPK